MYDEGGGFAAGSWRDDLPRLPDDAEVAPPRLPDDTEVVPPVIAGRHGGRPSLGIHAFPSNRRKAKKNGPPNGWPF